jgi:LysM repeat protein
MAITGSPVASAQSQNNQNDQSKNASNMVTVNVGDTLEGIATAHQTTYVRLFDANEKITDPDIIYPGDKIRIPDPDEKLPNRPIPSNAPPVTAVVQQTYVSAPVYRAPSVAPAAPVAGCGDNQYANFIYSHESGCRTTAMSPNGCYGIGQACSGSKIAYCGTDYACQNAYFTNYANSRYGGWEGAYSFWQSNGWW